MNPLISTAVSPRKIIHIDMDCFYAAVEIRDEPSLINKPVAVGGPADKRGVICTCNYIARRYGIHSAMATATAYRYCKDLIVLPVDMNKYREVAKRVHSIFREYTDIVEPLSLDEAYLDVTQVPHYNNSATLIAKAIRQHVWETEKLTASAGVAPSKFLAKIGSGWKKPNGLFVIRPHEVETFIKALPVNELYGVGRITAEKLHRLGLKTCEDLQQISLDQLSNQFGKLGQHLYEQCRGIDYRVVQPNRIRKSLSVEHTFVQDLYDIEACLEFIHTLHKELMIRIQESAYNRPIKNQYIKIKFNNFQQVTAETRCQRINIENYLTLFRNAYTKERKPIRLMGLGVHFHAESGTKNLIQQSLF